MKNFILLSIIFLSANLFSQTTLIPDVNFEQKLIDLGYDSGTPNGSILTTNINTITSLDCSSSNISSLNGLQDFTALIDLNCGNNLLTSLDLTQNIHLVSLFCASNLLTSLDLIQHIDLQALWCYNNQLSSIDLTHNLALVLLNCSSNLLTSLNITQNTLLSTFACSGNQLTSLDVAQNTSLIYFACSDNQLASLDVTQNILITDLLCDQNQITNLDVTQNIALISLYCFNNRLTNINLSHNIDLSSLLCDNNYLNCLNVKNGNNIGITNFYATSNPDLTCIEVDNVEFSTTNWLNIDSQTSFNTNCGNSCSLGLINIESNKIDKQVVKFIDLTGRETDFKTNSMLIKVYNDGSTEKVFSLE